MALLALQSIALPSLLPVFTAASGGGDTVPAGNDVFLVVKNGSGSTMTVTVVVPGNDEFGTAKPDMAVAVAAATERYIPLRALALQDLTTGLVSITYSLATSVTVGAFTT